MHIIENKELIPKLINKLILRGLNLTEEESCGVIKEVSDKIHKFDLGGNLIDTCSIISELIKDNKLNIKDLILYNNKLTNKSFEALAHGMILNFTLTSLDVSNNETATNITNLLDSLKDKPISNLNISIIPFANNHFSPSFTSLSELLRENKHLTSLNLSHTGLNDNGMTMICSSLAKNTSLSTLKLNNNLISFYLTNEGVGIIKDAFKKNSSLKTIDLSNNKITEFNNIGDCLKDNHSIESFTMNYVIISDQFNGLAEGLINKHCITSLEFGSCGLTDEDAKSLSLIIRTCPSLKKLALRKNFLFKESARLFSLELKQNKSIIHFEISWNNIRDEGIAYLNEAFIKNRTLEYIDLRSNYISEKGCYDLMCVLKENRNIKKIDLSFNNISDEFYRSNLINYKRIRFLYIEDCNLKH